MYQASCRPLGLLQAACKCIAGTATGALTALGNSMILMTSNTRQNTKHTSTDQQQSQPSVHELHALNMHPEV